MPLPAARKHILEKLYCLLLILAILGQTGCASMRRVVSHPEPGEVFDQATALVEKNYLDKAGKRVKLDTSMRPDVSTIVAQLDSSNVLYSVEDIQALGKPLGATGVAVRSKDGVVFVTGTFRGSPAREAGLRRGDKIIEIDGSSVSSLAMPTVIRLLEGEPGTEVSLRIMTQPGEERLLTLTRTAFEMPPSAAERLIERNIGYLRIERFWPDTDAAAVKAAMKRLDGQGIKGLVIDLRNNDGGVLTSIIGAAQLFLKRREVVVTLNTGSDKEQSDLKAWKWFPYKDFPITVLIDGQTSSGAEILAAALRDNKRALLVGEKSEGRCDIQTMYPLRDGSQLRIRTALAFAPGGAPIDGEGIKPDKEVSLTKEDQERLYDRMEDFPDLTYLDSWTDAQLNAAIMLLTESGKE